jgi:hypothetical protein
LVDLHMQIAQFNLLVYRRCRVQFSLSMQ